MLQLQKTKDEVKVNSTSKTSFPSGCLRVENDAAAMLSAQYSGARCSSFGSGTTVIYTATADTLLRPECVSAVSSGPLFQLANRLWLDVIFATARYCHCAT